MKRCRKRSRTSSGVSAKANEITRYLALAALAALLSACGGGSEPQATPAPHDTAPVRTLAASGPVQTTHANTVAQLYVAYFMRPADPAAEENFSTQLALLGVPDDIARLSEAYGADPRVRALVDSFASSEESQELHGNGTEDDVAFVSRIYTTVLNRTPDYDGLKFWSEAIRTGQLTRPGAALMIIAAAHTKQSPRGLRDGATIRNRVQFAAQATSELRRLELTPLYVGKTQAANARGIVSFVTDTDTPASMAEKLSLFIQHVKGRPIEAPPPRVLALQTAPGI